MSKTKLTVFQRLRCHPILYGSLQLLLVVGLLPAIFSFMSFMAVESPSQALAHGHKLPESWSGGVKGKGSYYQWFTIEDAPWLFGFTVVYLLMSLGHLFWLGYLGVLGLDR